MIARPILSVTLLAVAAMAPAAEVVQPAAPTATGPAELVNQLNKMPQERTQRQAAADFQYQLGLKAMENNMMAEAREAFKKAVDFEPNEPRYAKALAQADAVAGSPRNSTTSGFDATVDAINATQQQLMAEAVKLIEDGKRHMVEKEYGDAESALAKAQNRLQTLPIAFDNRESLLRSVTTLLEQVRVRREESNRESSVQRNQEAVTTAEKMRVVALQIERDRINAMLARAQRARDRRDYDEAIILAEQVIKIDRSESRAVTLLAQCRRERHVYLRQLINDTWEESHRRLSEQIRKDLLPQHELIRYSTQWPEIDATRRAPTYAITDEVDAWRTSIDRQLEQPISIDSPEQEFMEVIGFIQKVSGLNIIVDQVIATKPTPVQLRVEKMQLKNVLDFLMKHTGYKYTIRNEAVYISTEAGVEGDTILKFYDIKDLTHQLKDYPGPSLELPESDTAAGATILPPIESAPPTAQNSEFFINIIKQAVAPNSWADAGRSISESNGQMLVNQTTSVHKQIESLLRDLRNQSGTQIHVQVKFLQIENSSLEEIGVNWDQFDASRPGIIDPVTGVTGLPGTVVPGATPTPTNPGAYWGSGKDTVAGSLISSSLLPYTDTSGIGRPTAGEGLSLSGQYWHIANNYFARAVLHAVENERKGNVLFAPEITLFSGQNAHLVQLNEQAYIADYTASNGSYEPIVRTVIYGSVIDVRAVASADKRYITMTLRPTNAQVVAWRTFGPPPQNAGGVNIGGGQGGATGGASGSAGPGIGSNPNIGISYPLQIPTLDLQRVQTTVVVPDGGSMILAGLTNSSTARSMSGVPFLSHIPFLGRLFSTHGRQDTELKSLIIVQADLILYNEIEKAL